MPKMQAIADACKHMESLLPWLRIECDDGIMSSVYLRGSFDAKETWSNDIFMNSRHFVISLIPAKGARWYEGGNITAEFETGYKVDYKAFRKHTSTPEKIIAKIKQWIENELAKS